MPVGRRRAPLVLPAEDRACLETIRRFADGNEYKRLGTVSLLAGLDLQTGRVTEIVNNTHKSSDFIEFLTKLDAACPLRRPCV